MKKLLLIRHCKSNWDFEGLSDHDRPLNSRGARDVPRIASRLMELDPELNLVYHSTARRAADTAIGIFKLFKPSIQMVPVRTLYTFSSSELLRFIQAMDNEVDSAAIVSHNPGLTDLIVDLTPIRLDNLPTGGFCYLQFDVSRWDQVEGNTGTLKFLEFPKMLEL